MLDAIHALHHNKTWVLVSRQAHTNVIGCWWFFKSKLKSDGFLGSLDSVSNCERVNQLEGIDFTETFSPLIKPSTIRIVLTIATVKGQQLR